jgi:hypothetical protein
MWLQKFCNKLSMANLTNVHSIVAGESGDGIWTIAVTKTRTDTEKNTIAITENNIFLSLAKRAAIDCMSLEFQNSFVEI